MFAIQDITALLEKENIKYKISPLCHVKINSFCSFDELKERSVTWLKEINQEAVAKIRQFDNLLVFASIDEYHPELNNIIFVENLKVSFFHVIKELFSELDPDQKSPKIEEDSCMLTKCYGKNLYVGHNSFIDKDVEMGDNVTILHNTVIQGKVKIGNNCFIESGSSIGVCGFGYYRDTNNNPQKVPHLGGVIIGDNVTIGAGSCISRGSLNDTIIEDYVKTDNLCHIAHSVHLKSRVMLAACAEISGSVTIGEDTWIAPGVTVINGVNIGEGVYTGIGTNIIKSVPNDSLIYGNPGKLKGQ